MDQEDIGYKKPPQDSQFKKGQSGNPKGRPPKERLLANLFRKELNRKVIIHTNTGGKKVNQFEAIIMMLTQKAAQGNLQAVKALQKIQTYSKAGTRDIFHFIETSGRELIKDGSDNEQT